MADLCLLPRPRKMEFVEGVCAGGGNVEKIIDARAARPQGYMLEIVPQGVRIVGGDEAGWFYGNQTLRQIRKQCGAGLPCLKCEDWPDFPVRGVMVDISRDKVPTMATLRELVDLLAGWKINQFQLYTEHTFAYSRHRTVWKDASPMTAEEIRQLDEYCRERHVELVPNQNSLGHMERWLKHGEYAHLAEAAEGAETPWGYRWEGPFSLCPTDGRCLELLAELYAELLPNFSSGLFNVGCDETFDIGQGRSKAECEARGVAGVYLDFLQQISDLAASHGRRIQFWGDVILRHPEAIGRMPRGAIALQWGYEADHPFEAEGRLFGEAGVPFYVCPGTSSWLSITGRTDNMVANQLSAAENGLKHGAIGYLNTDWGDHGHLQYLPFSYPGFAAGAAYSWCLESNRDNDLAAALDLDCSVPGRMTVELGNVYKAVGKMWSNSSALFRILVPSSTHRDVMEGITVEGLKEAEGAIERAMGGGEAPEEYRNAARMLIHACRRGRWKIDGAEAERRWLGEDMRQIIREHCRLWVVRNREGGLAESAARLEADLGEYELGGRALGAATWRDGR